ncbi:MAG: c-type cytochrome [Gammaproteobacteria bacterium]|jgi:cytochrome c5
MNKMILIAAAAALSIPAVVSANGEATYMKACMACHMTGAAGAPKLGDKAAWAPRIAKGMDALYNSGLNGVPGSAMMPKGGQKNLADADVKAAVDYMVSKSK